MAGISSMEKIVRPFTAPNYSPRPRSLSFNITNVPAGVDVLISGTGGKVFTYSFDFSSTFTPTADATTYREQRRTEETVRVTNPDDPAQFVDVKQATSVDLAADPNGDPRFAAGSGNPLQRIKMMYNRINQK
jgi:hypothetical protein